MIMIYLMIKWTLGVFSLLLLYFLLPMKNKRISPIPIRNFNFVSFKYISRLMLFFSPKRNTYFCIFSKVRHLTKFYYLLYSFNSSIFFPPLIKSSVCF